MAERGMTMRGGWLQREDELAYSHAHLLPLMVMFIERTSLRGHGAEFAALSASPATDALDGSMI
jgi:hypothetical protein